jgi:hypothetical protein
LRLGGHQLDDALVFAWKDLPQGWSWPGPIVIQQDLATILVPQSYTAHVSALGDLELVKDDLAASSHEKGI